MLRFKSLPALLGVLAALAWASPSDASIVQALELEELVGQSDRILLGRVVFAESFARSNGTLGTWYRIEVERDLRGNAPEEHEVLLETLGGELGDIGMRVEGEPSFTLGERVVVFARRGGGVSAFRPVGMGQGVMRVRAEDGIDTVTQSREGLLLMRRNAEGRLVKSAGALPGKERLDVFLSRVRELVERADGGRGE